VTASTLIRDILPPARISTSRIRNLLSPGTGLGKWSLGQAGAIRPARLARLLRKRIWEAHDISVGAVKQLLEGAPSGVRTYRVEVEIDTGSDYLAVVSQTHFRQTSRGSLCADIDLIVDETPEPITNSTILLRAGD
jgi:hypothetical protein